MAVMSGGQLSRACPSRSTRGDWCAAAALPAPLPGLEHDSVTVIPEKVCQGACLMSRGPVLQSMPFMEHPRGSVGRCCPASASSWPGVSPRSSRFCEKM